MVEFVVDYLSHVRKCGMRWDEAVLCLNFFNQKKRDTQLQSSKGVCVKKNCNTIFEVYLNCIGGVLLMASLTDLTGVVTIVPTTESSERMGKAFVNFFKLQYSEVYMYLRCT